MQLASSPLDDFALLTNKQRSARSQSACSCTDCLEVCEAPVIEVESEIFKVGEMDGVLFVMILVAGVGSAVLLPVLCICCTEEKMMAKGHQEGEFGLQFGKMETLIQNLTY